MGSNQRQTTITLEQITMIAEALSAWQQTWLCRNPDLTHMTDEEVTRARMRAAERARPALELLTELHSEFFRVPIHPAPVVPGAEEVEAIRARHEACCFTVTKTEWQERAAFDAHTDRANLLSLLDAERAARVRLEEKLRLFVGAATPVSTEINPRGYAWSEAYLDQALAAALQEKTP